MNYIDCGDAFKTSYVLLTVFQTMVKVQKWDRSKSVN